MSFRNFKIPYSINEKYNTQVAYFSMEFAIHQPLKIYSGGLGFLSGSHLRGAYQLKQNLIGIGILWKFGYYDQIRNQDQSLNPVWMEKSYSFLVDTDIRFQILIHNHPVWVKAMYLPPETFKTAPLFLLTTDVPENDYLSQTISHKLYDSNVSTKVAQFILLGVGGAKLVDELGLAPNVYHLNEAHGLSAAFYLLNKLKSLEALKKLLVFTTHTPEEAGNEKHDIYLCQVMGYFCGLTIDEVRRITGIKDNQFNHSLVALRFARKANGVSKLHGKVARKMWGHYSGICEITSITNAQDYNYWADERLYAHLGNDDNWAIDDRKWYLKQRSFEIVADQTGKLFNPNVLTIVWSRRFAGYKRPDLLTWDIQRFENLLNNEKHPVQIIWAGKPYPMDTNAINIFNQLVHLSKRYKNVAVLVGYEMTLSRRLKQGADVWLNTPRITKEASGTSGMTAAMNGAVNLSTDDGWIPEFANQGINSFVVPVPDYENMTQHQLDEYDMREIFDLLENKIVPTYYEHHDAWREIVKQGMRDVKDKFDSKRMADEYYEIMYKQ